MRRALIIAAAMLATTHAFADPVRLGERNYSIDDGDETTNMANAQYFCQRMGYAFASLDYTRYEPSLGHMFTNHDTTRFYCLNNGESKPPLSANTYNFNVHNY